MVQFRRTGFAFALVSVVVFAWATTCSAGTTGSMSGLVTDTSTQAPIANARVSAVSPSQSAVARTDAAGHFYFVSLSPDSYVVSVEAPGYEPASIAGAFVQADQTQTLPTFALRKALQTIGRVSARAASDLVKPGTTIDVYSVTPAQSAAAAPLGGGASLNSLYSGLATAPGLFIPPEQQGPNQSVFIRGGYYDQVGYEYDGVPVNRSFDNYPGGTGTSLGQQELQVYTGGGTAGASAVGLAGFINQVIRTGTYPGFATLEADLGGPTFYHKLQIEAGGATANRNLSYYVAATGWNQDYRYLDQFNGAGQMNTFPYATGPSNQTTNLIFFPAVYPNCVGFGGVQDPFSLNPGQPGYIAPPVGQFAKPGCFSAISPAYASISSIADREAVANVHIGIPHRHDGLKDDVQVLYSTQGLFRQYYSSINDAGAATIAALNSGIPPTWPDYVTFPAGTQFGQLASTAKVVPYLYPFGSHGYLAPFPADYRGGRWDDGNIFKLQYQKNLSSRAYLRVFGYTFYSDTLRGDPTRRALGSGFGATNYDYEVSSHTRGAEAQLADQLSDKHQIIATLNVVTARTDRYFNTNYFNTSSAAVSNLTNGLSCFAFKGGKLANGIQIVNAGDPAPCNDPITQGTFQYPVPIVAIGSSGPQCISSSSSSFSSFGGPCPIVGAAEAAGAQYRITYTGNQGFENRVTPTFTEGSLEDQFHPNDKLAINIGARFENDVFDLASTQSAGKNFWFRAAQNEFCYDPATLLPVLVPVPAAEQSLAPPWVGLTCPSRSLTHTIDQTVHPDGKNGHLLLSNTYNPVETDTYFLPRVGLTYTLNPDTVLRASAGRFAQGPQNYEIQYNSKEENLAASLFQGFWQYGFTTPRHDPLPQFSDDYDISYERHFKGTDMSMKATPYYRYATNQLYGISAAGLSSALNVGTNANYGIELQFTKGDFNRNGFSGLFSYTYLWSKTRYSNFANTSVNPVDVYNNYIQQFNVLTKAGGGAPCYGFFVPTSSSSNGGTVTPKPNCPMDSVRNPYYTMAPQPLFDKFGWYQTGLDSPWNVPHAFTGILNYRNGRLAITPAATLNAGTWYGTPSDVVGLDPRTCQANSLGLTGSPIVKVDPLKPDYTSCLFAATPSGSLYIPNPQTGHFDGFGQYQQPWQFNLGMNIAYDFSPKVRANLILANLYNTCFGGSSTPWSKAFPPNAFTCGYLANTFYIANFYNGVSPNDRGANGVPLNPYFAQSFIPSWADQTSLGYVMPFNAYLQFTIKL
ncbi:MAG: TonB-dependent receptor [Candidatus Eremiobacteraeota bacterium]|nr:TonB-dependent receptor [Candidatus Eremiobacteraeota bacterium]